MKEQYQYKLIKAYVEKGGNFHSLCLKLGCSKRTARRKIAGYRKFGKAFFRHKNHDKKPRSTISEETKTEIIKLYNSYYYDTNFTHFYELLNSRHPEIPKVSLSSLRNIFQEVDILSPKAWRRTKKALKNKDRMNATVVDDTVVKKPAIASQPHPRREKSKFAGEIVFLDASPHLWFGSQITHLHAAIDDASGNILALYFDKQETLNGYYQIFATILKEYGIPYQFNTDGRTVFEYKRKSLKAIEFDHSTQFGYACKTFGVTIQSTTCAQAQGKVERLFQTLQSRLVPELRLQGVTSIEQANNFMKSYLDKFNQKFAVPLNDIPNCFEIQPTEEDINLTLAVLSSRLVDSGHCISYGKNYYRFIDSNAKPVFLKPKQKVQVIKALDGNLFACCEDSIFALEKVSRNKEISPNLEIVSTKDKYTNKYIPDIRHPWRNDNFKVFATKEREKKYSFMELAYTTENLFNSWS